MVNSNRHAHPKRLTSSAKGPNHKVHAWMRKAIDLVRPFLGYTVKAS